ncbi:cytochrome c [Helicobacter mastomyrinus]|uniref:Cytochrome c n=1 Tax=Helicobacter mastomyrinus TaxID=287948 RepID=A0ABZ3F1Q9_9HELI
MLYIACLCFIPTVLLSKTYDEAVITSLKNGGKLYKKACAQCHGGKGKSIPPGGALHEPIAGMPYAVLESILLGYRQGMGDNGGAKGTMSASLMRFKFTDQDIRDIALYVENLKPKEKTDEQKETYNAALEGYYYQVAAYKGQMPPSILSKIAQYPYIVHMSESKGEILYRYLIGAYAYQDLKKDKQAIEILTKQTHIQRNMKPMIRHVDQTLLLSLVDRAIGLVALAKAKEVFVQQAPIIPDSNTPNKDNTSHNSSTRTLRNKEEQTKQEDISQKNIPTYTNKEDKKVEIKHKKTQEKDSKENAPIKSEPTQLTQEHKNASIRNLFADDEQENAQSASNKKTKNLAKNKDVLTDSKDTELNATIHTDKKADIKESSLPFTSHLKEGYYYIVATYAKEIPPHTLKSIASHQYILYQSNNGEYVYIMIGVYKDRKHMRLHFSQAQKMAESIHIKKGQPKQTPRPARMENGILKEIWH